MQSKILEIAKTYYWLDINLAPLENYFPYRVSLCTGLVPYLEFWATTSKYSLNFANKQTSKKHDFGESI